jgi:hypothetical protein
MARSFVRKIASVLVTYTLIVHYSGLLITFLVAFFITLTQSSLENSFACRIFSRRGASLAVSAAAIQELCRL